MIPDHFILCTRLKQLDQYRICKMSQYLLGQKRKLKCTCVDLKRKSIERLEVINRDFCIWIETNQPWEVLLPFLVQLLTIETWK